MRRTRTTTICGDNDDDNDDDNDGDLDVVHRSDDYNYWQQKDT